MLIINRDLFTWLFIYHLFPLKSKVFLVNLMEVRNGWGCEGPLMYTKESRCRKNRVVLWRQTGPALHCLPEGRFSKQCSWCYLFRFSVQNGEKSVVVENEIMQPLVLQHKGRHLGTGSPSDSFFSDKKAIHNSDSESVCFFFKLSSLCKHFQEIFKERIEARENVSE